ncbi:MAG: hypothetical protein WA609_12200 [Terriglobales bacterium]
MQTVEEQLVEALDEIAEKHGDKTALVIYKSAVTAEEQLALARQVLDGSFQESVPAWRRTQEPKVVVDIRESLGLQEPTVRKRNGAADNAIGRSKAADRSNERLIEAAKNLGLSQQEAELFAEGA